MSRDTSHFTASSKRKQVGLYRLPERYLVPPLSEDDIKHYSICADHDEDGDYFARLLGWVKGSDGWSLGLAARSGSKLIEPNPDAGKVFVDFGGTMMKIRCPVAASGLGAKRGKVTGFSDESRRRLMEKFSSLRMEALMGAWLARVSWSDDCLPVPVSEIMRCLKQFQTELSQGFPDYSLIWKREAEPRKSGEHVGEVVSHLHLAVVAHGDGCSEDVFCKDLAGYTNSTNAFSLIHQPGCCFREFGLWLSETWHRIIGSNDPNNLVYGKGWHLEPAYGEAYWIIQYLAKYHCKPGSEGHSAAELEVASAGRWWGVWNKRCLPLAERVEVELSPSELFHLGRLARSWLTSSVRRSQPHVRVRMKKYVRKLARSGKGFSCFGLSDYVAARMVIHARELAL